MKKIIILLAVLMLVNVAFSLEKEKITEVGFIGNMPVISIFSTAFPSYSFVLKFGNEASLLRLSSLDVESYFQKGTYISGNEVDTMQMTTDDNSFSFGFAFGREKRKKIDDNFEFRYGGDILLAYSKSVERDESEDPYLRNYIRHTFNPGIELLLGFNYVIKEKFVIGVEINPGLYYTNYTYVSERIYDVDDNNYSETSYDQFSFNIDDVVKFSFSYRF
ncbi:MAG: hypothetical protein WCT23_05345 [Candidatus Neomarinimicrobiota bacterium]